MSTTTSIAVMDQFADRSDSGHSSITCSALAHVGLSNAEIFNSESADSESTVSLVEGAVTGLLVLRATASADELSKVLKTRCGIELSTRLHSNVDGEYCIRWMAPDSWLLSCPLEEAYDIENNMRAGVSGHVAIVNVSGGYCMLELSGPDARNVLMKSTGYDTHPDHLPVGKVVNTTFAKAQVTLRCLEAHDSRHRYEIIVRRSFSDYVWLWLQRASSEYGMKASTLAD